MADSGAIGGGAVSGAASGASIGTAVAPGIGTAIGAGVGALAGALGGYLGSRDARKMRRRQRRAIHAAQKFAAETAKSITDSPLFSRAQSFLLDTFTNAADSPLAQDFAKGIRQAQSVRGTFTGNLSAAQEGLGLSAFSQQLRTNLLSPALQFATAGEQIRQSVLAQEAPLRVAAATGAPIFGQGNIQSPLGAILSQGLSGAAGGASLGNKFFDEPRAAAAAAATKKDSGLSAILSQIQQDNGIFNADQYRRYNSLLTNTA